MTRPREYPTGHLVCADDSVLYGMVLHRAPHWGIATPGLEYVNGARRGWSVLVVPEVRVRQVHLYARDEVEAQLRENRQSAVNVPHIQAIRWPTSDEVHARLVALGWA